MPVLTAIDICSIQSFIFSSNKLKDIINNSMAVEWATATSKDSAFCIALNKLRFDQNSKHIEVIMSGGGNLLLNIDNIENAKSFVANYSRTVYDYFPNMRISVINRPYNESELALSIGKIFTDLAIDKNRNLSDSSLHGLGVTINDLKSVESLKERGLDFISNLDSISSLKEISNNSIYTFADEFDKLGRSKNNISYLGIVHIDGNSIGEKINKWLQDSINNNEKDDTVKKGCINWSNKLKEIANKAIKSVYKKIIDNLDYKGKQMVGLFEQLFFDLNLDSEKNIILPIRPIIIGGDDITFVCDGRLALSLAEVALKTINTETIEEFDNNHITACAGVAFINTHSPFIRGYELAESLCDNAKKEAKKQNEESSCYLDWHIGKIRPFEKIPELRIRQYTNRYRENFNLTLKPYELSNSKLEFGTWNWLSETVLANNDNGFRNEFWMNRKNKIKGLISELKQDTKTQFRDYFNSLKAIDKDIDLKLPQGIEPDGLTNNIGTALIDAVEIIDIHQVLL